MRRLGALLLLALIATGCTPAVPEDPPLGMVLAPDGVRQADSPLEVGFGRAEKGAVDAVVKLLGEYAWERSRVWGCGIAVDWLIGFRMIFVDGAFAGWTAEPGRIDTGGRTFQTLPNGRIGAGVTCVSEA